MKIDSVCKLRRSFLHFQKFVTRVLWIFMYVVKYMSSLELPLFLLSYLGRSLKHSGSSPWEVLGAWWSKYTVWFLNRKSHCERSHSWSEEQWCEQWRSLSLPVFWLIFNIRPGRVRTEGDCQETYPVKGPWEDECSSRRLVSDGYLDRRTVCMSFIMMCSLLPCKRVSAVCPLGQVS